MKGKLEH